MSPLFVVLLALCAVAVFMTFAGPAENLPTVRIKKGSKTLVINKSDLSNYKGWKVVEGDAPDPGPEEDEPEDDDGGGYEPVNPVALAEEAGTVADLDEIIDDYELDVSKDLNKEDKRAAIIEALQE